MARGRLAVTQISRTSRVTVRHETVNFPRVDLILWFGLSAKSVKVALIVELICPKANNHAVSNAKLLITATAIVKSPIGRLGIRRIASRS